MLIADLSISALGDLNKAYVGIFSVATYIYIYMCVSPHYIPCNSPFLNIYFYVRPL